MAFVTRFFLVFTFMVAVVSCAEEKIQPPADLIGEGEMIMILKDISKVEARFQRRLSLHGKHNNDLVFENYKVVFDEYQVSLDQFKSSYTYYQDSPEVIQQMYDSVIVELTKEQSQLEAELEAENQKAKK